MMAALNSPGQTVIKAKKSRDHTENMLLQNSKIQMFQKPTKQLYLDYKTA